MSTIETKTLVIPLIMHTKEFFMLYMCFESFILSFILIS